MNVRTFKAIVFLCLLLPVTEAFAIINSVSVSSSKSQLVATASNSVALTWNVSATAQRLGVNSTSLRVINASTGATLVVKGGALSDPGSGPYTFPENIIISAAEVQGWISLGVSSVRLERTFNDPGGSPSKTASAFLSIQLGQLQAVSVSTSSSQLVSTAPNNLTLTWRVSATGLPLGVRSSAVKVINPLTGSTLALKGGLLSDSGSGPLVLSENIILSAAEVLGWIKQGASQVVLERTFENPATNSTQKASARLTLSRSQLQAVRNPTVSGLIVQSLRLEFESGHSLALVPRDGDLQAKLILVYSGTGLLEGRWLLAEPGSTEGKPLFRTLALVRQHLMSNQRTILESPELPTRRGGKYLLRFCVKSHTDTATTEHCPVKEVTVQAGYQVQANPLSRILNIQSLSPTKQRVNSSSTFSWRPVPGASIYQIQIFSLLAGDEKLPSSKAKIKTVEPQFITGMVLPAATTVTTLSELVSHRLQTGQGYLWRVTAHDPSGRLLASSKELSFYYVKLP